MDLKEYEQEKFGIADIIRSAQAVETKDEALQSECRDLLTRLAEDRFNLLVVGRFSRGKSTLMNAILGGDLLPTGTVPLTSVITTVRYGSRNRSCLTSTAVVRAVRSLFRSWLITLRSNRILEMSKISRMPRLSCPSRSCVEGSSLLIAQDWGLRSENTQTTERFLPQADAFVLVTSYESPLSEEEDRILHRVRLTNKRLFVVLNKQDTVSATEREEALAFVTERLQRFSFSENSHISLFRHDKGSRLRYQEIRTSWRKVASGHLRRSCCGFLLGARAVFSRQHVWTGRHFSRKPVELERRSSAGGNIQRTRE